MKKFIWMFFAVTVFTFMSCGNSVGSSNASDTTAVDTVDTITVDSDSVC